MSTISAVIIAKNEEALIADCIDSVLFCNEIVVIDGGSSDKTIEIAKKMGAVVYSHTLTDFSQVRNLGLAKARGEWIFYIDADERAGNALIESIQTVVKENSTQFAAYKVQRQNFYLGHHAWPKIETMERLFRKSNLHEWYGKLHESPKFEGAVGILDGFLLHYTHRNLAIMVAKTNVWSKTEAKLRFDAKHPHITWWRFPRVMIPAFFHSYIREKGYKTGMVGLIESMYQSFSIFITYAKLWEMQEEKK